MNTRLLYGIDKSEGDWTFKKFVGSLSELLYKSAFTRVIHHEARRNRWKTGCDGYRVDKMLINILLVARVSLDTYSNRSVQSATSDRSEFIVESRSWNTFLYTTWSAWRVVWTWYATPSKWSQSSKFSMERTGFWFLKISLESMWSSTNLPSTFIYGSIRLLGNRTERTTPLKSLPKAMPKPISISFAAIWENPRLSCCPTWKYCRYEGKYFSSIRSS